MTSLLPAQLIGSKLDRTLIEQHVFGESRTLISVYLVRSDQEGIRLKVASNGWGLVASSEPPRPSDLGESGVIEVRSREAADRIPGGRVVDAWSVHSARSPQPVGVRLVNDAGDEIVIYGYDDTLLVSPPNQVELDDVSFAGSDEA
jgi:hypothetical protein